jgi:hypothetical protein
MDEWDFGPAQEDLSGWGDWGETPDQQGVFNSGYDSGFNWFGDSDLHFDDWNAGSDLMKGQQLGEELYFDDWNQGSNLGINQTLSQLPDSGWDTSGVQDTLAKIFANPKTWQGLFGGIMDDRSRAKARTAADPRRNIQWLQQNTPQDPTKAMRDNAQAAFIQANQDPRSVAIVRDQLNAIQDAQNRKDAAAGRRSNMIGSAPAVLGAQGKVINDYLQNMAQFRIQPNAAGLSSLYGQGNSQLMDALKGGDIGGLMAAIAKILQENPSLAALPEIATNPIVRT